MFSTTKKCATNLEQNLCNFIPEEGPSFRVERSCSTKRLLKDEELLTIFLALQLTFEETTTFQPGNTTSADLVYCAYDVVDGVGPVVVRYARKEAWKA